jgi:hypothetical protein
MVPEIVEVPGNIDEAAAESTTAKPVEGFIPFRCVYDVLPFPAIL